MLKSSALKVEDGGRCGSPPTSKLSGMRSLPVTTEILLFAGTSVSTELDDNPWGDVARHVVQNAREHVRIFPETCLPHVVNCQIIQ